MENWTSPVGLCEYSKCQILAVELLVVVLRVAQWDLFWYSSSVPGIRIKSCLYRTGSDLNRSLNYINGYTESDGSNNACY
jgi:hypothetical protein